MPNSDRRKSPGGQEGCTLAVHQYRGMSGAHSFHHEEDHGFIESNIGERGNSKLGNGLENLPKTNMLPAEQRKTQTTDSHYLPHYAKQQGVPTFTSPELPSLAYLIQHPSSLPHYPPSA